MHDATGPLALPPRIWVVGPCGCGKTTVAARLANALGIPPTHLDDIHWKPGWIETSFEEEREAIRRIVERPSWVVDGNYGRLRGPHLDRVDLFVWLDLPLRITLARLLRRCLVRSVKHVPCCNGNHESLHRTFLDKESILLWAVRTDAPRRRELARQMRGRDHVRLRSAGEIRAWLERVTGGSPWG